MIGLNKDPIKLCDWLPIVGLIILLSVMVILTYLVDK